MQKKDNSEIISYIIAFAILVFLLLPSTKFWFQSGGNRWIYILLLSVSISFCLTPVVKLAGERLDITDIPSERKLHHIPTPLLGGVAIFSAFLVTLYLNGIFSKELNAVVISASIVFITGLLDDIWGLSAIIRLLAQTAAVILLCFSGIYIIIFRHEGTGLVLNFLITYLWIIGITNSMNFFDGMDGLATGVSIIIAGFLGFIAFQTGQPFLGWLAITILGSCLGFLPHNFVVHGDAKIFMGDSGSNFLGFALASLAVMGEWSDKSIVASLATPLLIFSMLIYDTTYITVSRVATGTVSSFKGWLDYVGRDHLHHRVAALLQNNKKSVLFIYLINFTLGINALILRNSSSMDAYFLLLQAATILVIVTVFERAGNRVERRKQSR